MMPAISLGESNPFEQILGGSLDLPVFFEAAACVGTAPSLFDGESLADVLAAKQICAECPIRAMCLDWALATQDSGVWGGLTPQERKKHNNGKSPVDIGELRWLENNRDRLLSDSPASKLAAEFEVTERTICRWRKKMQQTRIAS